MRAEQLRVGNFVNTFLNTTEGLNDDFIAFSFKIKWGVK